jgi:hypothetical protein
MIEIRRDRIELQTEHWTVQMPWLVNAYLQYRSRDSGDGFPLWTTLCLR